MEIVNIFFKNILCLILVFSKKHKTNSHKIFTIIFSCTFINAYSQNNEVASLEREIEQLESIQNDLRADLNKLEGCITKIDKELPFPTNDCSPTSKNAVLDESNPCTVKNPTSYENCLCAFQKESRRIRLRRNEICTKRAAEAKSIQKTINENRSKILNLIARKKELDKPKEAQISSQIPKLNKTSKINQQSNKKVLSEYDKKKEKELNDLKRQNEEARQSAIKRWQNDPEYRKRIEAEAKAIREKEAREDQLLFENNPQAYAQKLKLDPTKTKLMVDMSNTWNKLLTSYDDFEEREQERKIAEEKKKKLEIRENEAWKNALTKNSIEGYRYYRKTYRKGKYRGEAYDRISKIQEEQNLLEFEQLKNMIDFEMNEIKIQMKSEFSKKSIVNHILQSMVKIQGEKTKFMGRIEGDTESVTIDDFYISQYELRLVDYVIITGEFPTYLNAYKYSESKDYNENNVNKINYLYKNLQEYLACFECPVVGLEQNDVKLFLNKIKEITSIDFRVPTRNEFSYVAYDFGKFVPYINVHDFAWIGSNSYPIDSSDYSIAFANEINTLQPNLKKIGTKKPNNLGLYDLIGNASEYFWSKDKPIISKGFSINYSSLNRHTKLTHYSQYSFNDFYEMQRNYQYGMRLAFNDSDSAESVVSKNQPSANELFLIGFDFLMKDEYSLAFVNLNKAANGGHRDALTLLSVLHINSLYGKTDFVLGKKYAEKAYESGDNLAGYVLGWIYRGLGGHEEDIEKSNAYFEAAFKKLIKLSDQNSFWRNELARLYMVGVFVKKDEIKWYELTKKGVTEGNSVALRFLANQNLLGLGTEKNLQKGLDSAIKSAEAGNADAMYLLSEIYDSDYVVERDWDKSQYWLYKALDNNSSDALKKYGYSLLAKKHTESYWGNLVRHNLSIKYLEMASMAGNIEAMFYSGQFYDVGKLTMKKGNDSYVHEPNWSSAFLWYKKAADLGHSESQIKVGEFYFFGYKSIKQSFEYAEYYWNLAKNSDNKEVANTAENKLNILSFYYPKRLDNLINGTAEDKNNYINYSSPLHNTSKSNNTISLKLIYNLHPIISNHLKRSRSEGFNIINTNLSLHDFDISTKQPSAKDSINNLNGLVFTEKDLVSNELSSRYYEIRNENGNSLDAIKLKTNQNINRLNKLLLNTFKHFGINYQKLKGEGVSVNFTSEYLPLGSNILNEPIEISFEKNFENFDKPGKEIFLYFDFPNSKNSGRKKELAAKYFLHFAKNFETAANEGSSHADLPKFKTLDEYLVFQGTGEFLLSTTKAKRFIDNIQICSENPEFCFNIPVAFCSYPE